MFRCRIQFDLIDTKFEKLENKAAKTPTASEQDDKPAATKSTL